MTNARLITNYPNYLVVALLTSILFFSSHQSYAAPLWYAGGSLGYTDYDSDNIETDLSERQAPGSSTLRNDKIPWHLFVGYQHNRYLAFELGYQYLDRQEGTTVLQSQPTISADTSRETDGFMVSINGILPINNKYAAQVMGGVYLSHVVTGVNSLSGGGAIAINFDDRSSQTFTGVGIQYLITHDTAFHVQWLNFNVDDDQANILNIGFTHQFLVMTE